MTTIIIHGVLTCELVNVEKDPTGTLKEAVQKLLSSPGDSIQIFFPEDKLPDVYSQGVCMMVYVETTPSAADQKQISNELEKILQELFPVIPNRKGDRTWNVAVLGKNLF